MAHSHDTAPNVPVAGQMDDPEPGSTWVVSIGGVIVFVALVLFLCVLYFNVEGRVEAQVAVDVPIAEVVAARTAQKGLLAQYERYEQTLPDGKVVPRLRIPVDRAMELVAAQLATPPATPAAAPAAGKPAAAGPAGAKP
jgi:hypothetical protein